MNPEPRFADDYSERQTEAAHRVLVDLGQVLASYRDCVVVVGGWVPDLLIKDASEPHVKSIDVDLALDAAKLTDGRYAELIRLLLETRRYERSEQAFRLFTTVDLGDGQNAVRVDVDFLAPKEFKMRSRRPKMVEGFRVLLADGCGTAFRAPVAILVEGRMVNGASNSVELRVASLPDFLVMKCYALEKREKPKDAYDICFCLDQVGDGGAAIAAVWKERLKDKDVAEALRVLRTKFRSVEEFGPQQVVEFHQSTDLAEREVQGQRAYQLVQRFLGKISS